MPFPSVAKIDDILAITISMNLKKVVLNEGQDAYTLFLIKKNT